MKIKANFLTGDLKVSELESVRIHFLPTLSKIGKCQGRKVAKSESVRNGKYQNWRVSETAQFGKWTFSNFQHF